ncbi:retrovirus-related pol polyprotein from transposon TNT 1-94 [Tanacetum coccineum]
MLISTLKKSASKTNNEVNLLYLDHPNKKTFRCVSNFISKYCLREAFIRTPTQYKEYLCEFWYTAKFLKNPTGFGSLLLLGVLKKNQPEGPPFNAHMLAICNADEPVAFEAPNTSSYNRKKVSKDKKPGATAGHKRKQSSSTTKHNTGSKIKATKGGPFTKETTGSKTGHSKKKKSILAKDLFPSQPPASTPVPIYSASTIIHSESASGHDVSAASTTEADPGKTYPNDLEASKAKKEVSIRDDEFNTSPDLSISDDAQKEIKLEDLSKLVKNVEVDFMDLDSPEDDAPIIIQDKDEEEVHTKKGDAEKLLVKSLTSELSKLLSSYDFSNSLPTKLKELPFKFNDLTREIKELKKHVHELEIELPGDMKEIPTKLEKFTSTISSRTIQVSELKTLQWELPTEFLFIPDQILFVQAKINTLDALPSLLLKVTKVLNRPTNSMVESSKKKKLKKFDFVSEAGDHVHLTKEQIKEQKRIEKLVKADLAKKEEVVGKEELIDLVGVDVVTNMYKAQIKMELYMQNREHGRMILDSIEHGPLIWPTIEENGMTRTKKYEELSATEKIQADCDLKATNIILQGLPTNERGCKLYDAFDKFTHIKEESLNQYYLRFTQLINDMNIYKMKLEQFQIDFGLAVPVFKQGDDPIDAINKMMSFLSTVGRQSSFAVGTSGTRANISGIRGYNSGQQRVVKCFNCQGEGHTARQCPKPKRKRDATCFRDKVLLVEAQGSRKVLNKEELEFLADPGVAEGPVTQTVITHNAAYQAEDLDVYDSDCDDFSTAKAVLMASLSSYGSDVLFEEKEAKSIDKEIALEKKVKELDNIKQALGFQNPLYLKKAQQIRPMLYDGSVIAKETNVISIADSKETLMLEEESRSKMLLKQKLSDEQAFRLQISHHTNQSASLLVKIEAPRELPKVSLVNTSLKRLKYHLGQFDNVVKKQITPDALTEGNGEQAAILKEIVKQAKSLNPLDSASYSTCKYVKWIQELLGYIRDTCPDIHKPSKKLVAIMPINKKKTVRFAELVISSSTSQK